MQPTLKKGLLTGRSRYLLHFLWDSNKGGLTKSMLTGSVQYTVIEYLNPKDLCILKSPILNKKYFHINCIVKPATKIKFACKIVFRALADIIDIHEWVWRFE